MTVPTLDIHNLVKRFPGPAPGQLVHAVNGVSFALRPGQTVGMVGESGSGKSTVGRAALRLLRPTEGRIFFDGADISEASERQCRPLRAHMQMVFQDPWSSLNPRIRVRRLIAEPLVLHANLSRTDRNAAVDRIAARVQLPPAALDRFPGELSGGQLQRVCIARAIATNPKLIVLDEPTSSLDLSVRAGILALLSELRAETGAAMLFISHDLGTIRLVSERIMVLYLGFIVEEGPTAAVFARPAHPYTQALLSAHLPPDPRQRVAPRRLKGEIPSPINLPRGCPFASRCPLVVEDCHRAMPPLQVVGNEHRAACIRLDAACTTA